MFDSSVALILKLEGGDKVVDHPKDPGGVTKYGICLRAYPHLGRDGIVNLTKAQAIEIYRTDYWNAASCHLLPPGISLAVFDCAVNQGVGTAIKLLQKALNVPSDGKIGKQTLEAVHRRSHPQLLVEFMARRMVRYGLLKTFSDFGLGWARRLMYVFGVSIVTMHEMED